MPIKCRRNKLESIDETEKSKSKQPLMKCFKQKERNVESKNCAISLPRNFGLLLTGESKLKMKISILSYQRKKCTRKTNLKQDINNINNTIRTYYL